MLLTPVHATQRAVHSLGLSAWDNAGLTAICSNGGLDDSAPAQANGATCTDCLAARLLDDAIPGTAATAGVEPAATPKLPAAAARRPPPPARSGLARAPPA